jgi:hypothetical protein
VRDDIDRSDVQLEAKPDSPTSISPLFAAIKVDYVLFPAACSFQVEDEEIDAIAR